MKARSKQQSCWNLSWLILIHIFSIILALLLSNLGAARKVFTHWSQKNKTTSLFNITFQGELLHALLLQSINTITYNNGIKNIFDDED